MKDRSLAITLWVQLCLVLCLLFRISGSLQNGSDDFQAKNSNQGNNEGAGRLRPSGPTLGAATLLLVRSSNQVRNFKWRKRRPDSSGRLSNAYQQRTNNKAWLYTGAARLRRHQPGSRNPSSWSRRVRAARIVARFRYPTILR